MNDDDMTDDSTNVTSPHVSNIARCGDSTEITDTYSHSQQIMFKREQDCGRKYQRTESVFKP